jgi:hypothetical protein
MIGMRDAYKTLLEGEIKLARRNLRLSDIIKTGAK